MFGDKLQQVVTERGIEVRQLCSDLDIELATYRKWVSSQSMPHFKNLSALTVYLGVSLTTLLDGTSIERQILESDAEDDKPFTPITGSSKTVKEKLKELAYYRGVTLSELPDRCSLSIKVVRSVLDGPLVSLVPYQIIADYFKIPVWILLCEEPMNVDTTSTLECNRYRIGNIGGNLASLRGMQGLSQARVSRLLGIQQSVYRNYESGDAVLPARLLHNVCELYNVSIKELTSRLAKSRRVHKWFLAATLYERLKYFEAIHNIDTKTLSGKVRYNRLSLEKCYRSGAVPIKLAERLARVLQVPTDWIHRQDPVIPKNVEIR